MPKQDKPLNQVNVRRPLAINNVYCFKNHKTNGFKITGLDIRDGIFWVLVQWFGSNSDIKWNLFKNEEEFWENILFRDACNPEDT